MEIGKETEKFALSQDDLVAQFNRQLQFLKRSAEAFDAGFEDEAVRLATTLRVLLHSKKRSLSLLAQIGKTYQFFDSSSEFDPENLMPHSGLVGMAFVQGTACYAAFLDDVPSMKGRPFDDWWADKVFVDTRKRVLTRKDLVLTAANQDGGAHVDPKLNSTYSDLHTGNGLGWKSTSGQREIAMGSPVYPAIRQITHEVLKTLIDGYTNSAAKKYEAMIMSPILKNLGPAGDGNAPPAIP